MECNRDEALRALEIAEKKLASQDYNGAQKFLQKALQLFPKLENTTQLSCVLDVHIAGQKKINGVETDWYSILQVDPRAEEVVIKKQYKKLALLLHPDKNKSSGAESAFKLIGEALQVLSDKQQRAIHDSRRKQVNRTNFSTVERNQNKQTNGSSVVNKATVTFLTMCPACHTMYQHYRVYENQNLICHQCRNPFMAREFSGGPSNGNDTRYNAFTQQFSHAQKQGSNATTFQSHSSDPASGKTSDHMNNVFKEKQCMDGAQGGVKRKRSEEKEAEKQMKRAQREQQQKARSDQRAQEALEKMMKKKKEEEERKRRKQKKHLSDSSSNEDEETEESMDGASENEIANQGIDAKAESVRRSARPRRKVTYNIDASDDDDGEDPSLSSKDKDEDKPSEEEDDAKETRKEFGLKGNSHTVELREKEKLADFFKDRIRSSLNMHTNVKTSDASNGQNNDGRDKTSRDSRTEAKSSINEEESIGESQEDSSKKAKKHAMPKAKSVANSLKDEDSNIEDSQEAGSDSEELIKYTVPDPEFHNFDKEREEKDVNPGQIWAGYDDKEGLPRYYFKVKEVKSRSPFKVTITWLELCNINEQQRALKKLGYHPVCGACFRGSFSQELETVEIFSHILKWEKGPKGMIKIYPRKGEVWALYKDWKPQLAMGKESILFKYYEMVEVLSDFNEETGVSVTYMEKSERHKTVFVCSERCLEIPPIEICRFSFQVPSYRLKGTEANDIKQGFWELDPASVPRYLISARSDDDVNSSP